MQTVNKTIGEVKDADFIMVKLLGGKHIYGINQIVYDSAKEKLKNYGYRNNSLMLKDVIFIPLAEFLNLLGITISMLKRKEIDFILSD